jgi:aldehyde:ferredoxin oxidoreductase
MAGGYNSKIAFVNLSSGEIKEEELDEKTCRQFIGCVGLGVRILYERMKPKEPALGPNNLLGFVTGPLTGTGVPATPRYAVVAKSPLTGTWGDSSSGGFFAPELKAAGFDAVFFSGISRKPVYLLMQDGKAELKDAAHLWGKDTVETERILREGLGDQKAIVVCIGPVGEQKSLLATITHERRAAGRSGLGAVMGAKRLKAVVARGTKKVPVADANRLKDLRRKTLEAFKSPAESDKAALGTFSKYGTSGFFCDSISTGDAPIKNWGMMGKEAMPDYANLSGDEILKYLVRRHSCFDCPIGCKGTVRLDKGAYAVGETAKPEYETLAMFGPLCLNSDLESVIKATDVCNRYGIDTISTGAVIAFAIECYERGVIGKKDTGGIELTWGNAQAIIKMLDKIVRRDAFGAVLADGVQRAAKRIGKGSSTWAIHVHGQEVPAHDPRVTPGFGTIYTSDPTPGRHTRALELTDGVDVGLGRSWAPYPQFSFPKLEATDFEKKGPIYAVASSYQEYFAACGACEFLAEVNSFPLVEFTSAVTGWDFTIEEGLAAGRRIKTLRQAFNLREGLSPKDFQLPKRIRAALETGPIAGRQVDFEAFRKSYYGALGWDPIGGQPSEETQRKLGLTELLRDL